MENSSSFLWDLQSCLRKKKTQTNQPPKNPTKQSVHSSAEVVVDICSVEGDWIKRGASGESCPQTKIVGYTLQARLSCLQVQRWPVGASNSVCSRRVKTAFMYGREL